jgi:hypothetical protein
MNEKKSFWETLPGVVTAIAGLLTAVGSVIGILYQVGVMGPPKEPNHTPLPAPYYTALSMPIPEHPACGTVIKMPADQEFLVLKWGSVDGASTYTIEVDCIGCGQYPNKWYSLSGMPWHVKSGIGLRAPIYSSKVHVEMQQAGGRSLRWRVWAVDSNGKEGKKSDWCQLAFYGD